MSFDLYIWHESQPITAAEAWAKLERWGADEPAQFASHPAVTRFYDALLDRFPALESLSDEDIDRLGVWSMTPDRSDNLVAASCVWSRADEVGTTIQALAVEHGLVCYEPGYHVVNPNAPGYVAPFTLSSESLPTMPDPDADRLEWITGKIGKDNRYIILERFDGWYVRIADGDTAAVPAGGYVLEYKEGASGEHFRCDCTDRQDAVRLLQEFRVGDEAWKRRHPWRPL